MVSDSMFVDFDGVICDSLKECFVSSWIAFHARYRGDNPNAIGLNEFKSFTDFRPFIRSGKDFVLIQELISDGVSAGNQDDFDRIAVRAGEEKMGTYESLLYQVRENLIATDSAFWLRLHSPFGDIIGGLHRAARATNVWIVSTKRPAYIRRILADWGISWPLDRIVLPVAESKKDVIGRIMSERGYATGVFIDDQPDHLRFPEEMGVSCYFASWAHGLVLPDHIGAEPIALGEFKAMLEQSGQSV